MSGCAYKHTGYAHFGGRASVAPSRLSMQGKHKPAGKRKCEIGARQLHIKSGRKGSTTPCRAGLIDDLVCCCPSKRLKLAGCAGNTRFSATQYLGQGSLITQPVSRRDFAPDPPKTCTVGLAPESWMISGYSLDMACWQAHSPF
jgi:hypothetical protein